MSYKKTYKRRRKKNNKTRKRRRRKTRKLKQVKCSPKLKKDQLNFTCYTKDSLHKLKNIWNKKHPDRKILTNNPRKIWMGLRKALKESCNRESCWLRHKCIKEDIDLETRKFTFAPEAPQIWKKNPTEWLSSTDILNVMRQYEKTYPCFEFIGPSPIDYDNHIAYGECVWEELCEFNLLKTLKDGKRKIGIIFNLDKHNQPGSHWVALFIHTKRKEIYYLDSYGEKIPKRIEKFANKVIKQALNLGDSYELIENTRRHQFSNSECGMYCLYFIIRMLKGDNFNKFTSKKIPDKLMMKLRKIYFNQ